MISTMMRSSSSTLAASALSLCGLFACGTDAASTEAGAGPAPTGEHTPRTQLREQPLHAPPSELFEVTRVVDGDTIHIQRGGETQKLRLLSVDTEEVLRGGGFLSKSKPQTVFGTECAAWAKSYFKGLANEDGATRIGLWFPEEEETHDVYGRLLCHVVLEDGTDFNLLLLEEGKSPYFNKYGNSFGFDAEFRSAQAKARREQLGIWNPATNEPKTPGAPAVRRPYDSLMPWWEARAQAIDSFRARHAADPLCYVDAGAPHQLELATRHSAPEAAQVELFGAPDRLFNEDDGRQTVLFRTSDRRRALRVLIPKEQVSAHAALDLASLSKELRQNFVWVTGSLRWTGRGYELVSMSPDQWRIAAPQTGGWSQGQN